MIELGNPIKVIGRRGSTSRLIMEMCIRDRYEYLKYLLRELPNIGDVYQSKLELLDRYMLWLKELPQECRLLKKKSGEEP